MSNKDDFTLAKELEEALGTSYPAKTAPLDTKYPRPLGTAKESGSKRPEGYEELHRILSDAYKQSATGKGKERHAYDAVGFRPWEHQPILANARQVGPGGLAQQVMKKAGESVGMANRKEYAAARAEALGAIVYAAALCKLYEEMEEAHGQEA